MPHDIPEMTLAEHHTLALGNMACCYRYVPPALQVSIIDGLELAHKMGFDIDPRKFTTLETFESVDENSRAN